jgi:hypothetical protein
LLVAPAPHAIFLQRTRTSRSVARPLGLLAAARSPNGSIVNLLASGARSAGLYLVQNQDNYFMMMRFQKNVLP